MFFQVFLVTGCGCNEKNGKGYLDSMNEKFCSGMLELSGSEVI